MSGDREPESDVHARRIALHRRVDELPQLSEFNDTVELSVDLATSHPENRAVQINVFAPGQLGMKTRSDFNQRREPSVDHDLAVSWRRDPRKELQDRALAGAVVADDAERFRALHFKTDVL